MASLFGINHMITCSCYYSKNYDLCTVSIMTWTESKLGEDVGNVGGREKETTGNTPRCEEA